jgi:hypothetical protein
MQLLRHQRVEVQVEQGFSVSPEPAPAPLSRTQRAPARLSWQERLARNGLAPDAGQVSIKLYGIPREFAGGLGLTA